MCGLFESEINFDGPFKKEILDMFTMKQVCLSPEEQDVKNAISDSISVAVHVRRGDMTSCLPDYVPIGFHMKMMAHMMAKYDGKDVRFFVFSDEIESVKKDLGTFPHVTFVSELTKSDMIVDFHLMMSCHHFIIPWSTFSWWASYLAPYKEKTIMVANRPIPTP